MRYATRGIAAIALTACSSSTGTNSNTPDAAVHADAAALRAYCAEVGNDPEPAPASCPPGSPTAKTRPGCCLNGGLSGSYCKNVNTMLIACEDQCNQWWEVYPNPTCEEIGSPPELECSSNTPPSTIGLCGLGLDAGDPCFKALPAEIRATYCPDDSVSDSASDAPGLETGYDEAGLNGDDGSVALDAASCEVGGAGLNDCGANSESCCTSLEVPGGTYSRTYTNSGTGPNGEADPASVGSYRLDKYLVTVGRFRMFVNAWNNGLGFTPAAGSGKHAHLNGGSGLNATEGGYEPGWLGSDSANLAPTSANLTTGCDYPPSATWTPSAGMQENLPINCVSWYEAYAFCIWDGGFLPSEAEWEYAAAGGSQQREYPWGSTDPGTGNEYAIFGFYYPPSGFDMALGVANFAPVGTATLGAGLWGQLDLAGEVFEWNLDSYDAFVDPCTDCANVTVGSEQVIRGGDYGNPTSRILSAYRVNSLPSTRATIIGFRCARTP
jgi:formylglycine-generating enzyme required for sulfatase activity